MRIPSEPHYSFTIPSIHDDTTLDCRIYHPDVLDEPPEDSSGISQWRKRGVVMAHPYAPMGGSYDDRVVGIVADELLKAGYIVGTFNFRGAHGAKHKSRTSWSGRPELDDYISFAACFMHYMSLIQPFSTPETTLLLDQLPTHPSAQQLSDPLPSQVPLIILGGYSYGSLILKHLPPVPSILQHFSGPLTGLATDEIILRASKLADQSNLAWINLARDHKRDKKKRKHEYKTSLTIGGEETSPDVRRSSREAKRSFETPHSLSLGHRLKSLNHRGQRRGNSALSLEQTDAKITAPEVRYLLISPLTPPISTLATPALGQRPWSRSKDTDTTSVGKLESLIIYGDQDIFVSAKKIRDWSDQLKTKYGSAFSSVEIVGAGHFWVEQGVEKQLRAALREWVVEGASQVVTPTAALKAPETTS